MKYLVWVLLWLPIFTIGLLARLISPFACLFVKRQLYYTSVKRFNREKLLLERDRLVWWLTWLDTFDNATDEYFYGMYGNAANTTQEEYDSSRWLRWWYRVLWLQRNSAYTFTYKFFSLPKDSKLAWQYENYKPINRKYRWNINCGWKAHDGFERLSYAGRFIGIKNI